VTQSRTGSIPRRILMTADTVGGVWTYAVELAAALAPHGVEVVLATMGGGAAESQKAEAAALPGVRLIDSAFKLEWMDNPWGDVRAAGEWLLALEQQFRPDVVHLNGYVHAQLPWTAPRLVVGHSCVLSWWRAVKDCDAPASWDRYREEVGAGLRRASLVVAPSRAMLAALEFHYGTLPRARVIPNARNPAAFCARSKQDFVFAAGRLWDEAKNIAALASIAPSLRWPVHVAGEGATPDATGSVHYLGRLPQAGMADWLSRASIYVMPARYEPFGLSILEAALSGCVLVLGDIESLRELWDDAACFVHPEDHEGLRAVLLQLIANQSLRVSYANRARDWALRYSPERFARQYLDAYASLLCCDEQSCPPAPKPALSPPMP
jgi:glycogen(starch) synthase